MAKYSDEEIRQMSKITCKIAADYLGVSPMAVSFGMREEKLPIGFAVHNKDRYTDSWSYNIVPERLIAYNHLAGFEVINLMVNPSIQPILAELEQAVEKEFSVEIDYRTSREEQPKNRMIDPYGMVYWNNKWNTVAFCHLRNEIRSFRVDRILLIKCTQIIFKRPEAFSTREFFMKNLLPDLVGKEGLISLIIEGRSEALDELCMHWFLGHHLKERTSNQAIFLFEEKSIHIYVPYFLLSYGKSIQIIEPQSLKERLVAIASELMEYYQL